MTGHIMHPKEFGLSVFLLLFSGLCPAWGADSLGLPAGEEPALWSGPLALADLISADGEATIQITVVGSRWRLGARSPGAKTRFVYVEAPGTNVEREEVALLARALARALRADRPPDPEIGPPEPNLPPPPPPLPPPPPPAPTVLPVPSLPPPPPPEPKPAPATDVDPETDTELILFELDAVSIDLPTYPEFQVSPTMVNSVGARPSEPARLVLSSPPLWWSTGLRARLGIEPALEVGLGVGVAQGDLFSARVEAGFAPNRGLELEKLRRMFDLRGAAVLEVRVADRVRVPVSLGLTYRAWSQEGRIIAATFVPTVRLGMEVSVLRVRAFEFGLRPVAGAELSRQELVTPVGGKQVLSPIELGIDVFVKKRLTVIRSANSPH